MLNGSVKKRIVVVFIDAAHRATHEQGVATGQQGQGIIWFVDASTANNCMSDSGALA